jgi:flagellar assembly protein FliH
MASPARFNFDLDFEPAPPPSAQRQQKPKEPEVPTVDLITHLLQLGEADAKGRAEGLAAGRASAEAQAADRLANEAARLANACQTMIRTLDADRLAVEKEAVDLALTIARKLAGRLLDREPLSEIRALLAECLGPLRKAPHLVLRINADDADAVRPHVDRLVKENGFEGRMVILGEDDMARGDCRIEWADGGIIRNSAHIVEGIEASIARYIEAREIQVSKTLK